MRIIVITDGFHVTVLLCGHTITGLVQCCQHHLIGYYTSSLEKSHSLLFYQDINDCNHGKVILRHKYQYQNLKFFFGRVYYYFQFGFKGIIVLSGN